MLRTGKIITFEQESRQFMNKEIYLAGGCFWEMQKYLKLIRGVISTEVGFANGHTENHQDYLDKNPKGYCHLTPELFAIAKGLNR